MSDAPKLTWKLAFVGKFGFLIVMALTGLVSYYSAGRLSYWGAFVAGVVTLVAGFAVWRVILTHLLRDKE